MQTHLISLILLQALWGRYSREVIFPVAYLPTWQNDKLIPPIVRYVPVRHASLQRCQNILEIFSNRLPWLVISKKEMLKRNDAKRSKAWFAFEYTNVTGVAHESTLSELESQISQLVALQWRSVVGNRIFAFAKKSFFFLRKSMEILNHGYGLEP